MTAKGTFRIGAAVRWALAVFLAAWSLRTLLTESNGGRVGHGLASGSVAEEAGEVRKVSDPDWHPDRMGAGAGHAAALISIRPDVSPRLEAEIHFLRAALAASLEGQRPLQAEHAGYLATWVVNLMIDAAYQDALDRGHELDPEHAREQVLQVLGVRP